MDKEGKGLQKRRWRPSGCVCARILMTSLAFMLWRAAGAISSGAGSGAQNAVGTGVSSDGNGNRTGYFLRTGLLRGGTPPL